MIDTEHAGPAWTETFMAALAETKIVTHATRAAGIDGNSAYYMRRRHPWFAERWDAALAQPAVDAEERPAEAAAARTGGWRTRFLEALARTSCVTTSAAQARVALAKVYKTRRTDPAFAAKWLAALHEGYDLLEIELLGYLRDPRPRRRMDVTAALRLLAAHRETVERRRALSAEDDELGSLESLDRFIEDMRQRRAANTAILLESQADDGAE